MKAVEKEETTFRVCEGNYKSEEGTAYTGYGLHGLNSDGEVICRAEDLSMDHEIVHHLAILMNEQGTEVTHFYEIVEDFLIAVT